MAPFFRITEALIAFVVPFLTISSAYITTPSIGIQTSSCRENAKVFQCSSSTRNVVHFVSRWKALHSNSMRKENIQNPLTYYISRPVPIGGPLLAASTDEASSSATSGNSTDATIEASSTLPDTSSSEANATTISSVDGEMKMTKIREKPLGWKNALFMGPPLFAKFVIVLVVKFLTDLVVFPCLFLYRVARLMKRRFIRLFESKGNEGGGSGEEGSSATA